MKTRDRMTVDVTYRRPDPVQQAPLPLLDGLPLSTADLTIAERFAAFHAANPQVYARLHELALAEWARGARRVSVKWLFEVLRREGGDVARGGEAYELNNIFTARYADLLAEDLRLAGLIERRTRKAE